MDDSVPKIGSENQHQIINYETRQIKKQQRLIYRLHTYSHDPSIEHRSMMCFSRTVPVEEIFFSRPWAFVVGLLESSCSTPTRHTVLNPKPGLESFSIFWGPGGVTKSMDQNFIILGGLLVSKMKQAPMKQVRTKQVNMKQVQMKQVKWNSNQKVIKTESQNKA